MADLSSGVVQPTQVYAQAEPPKDERDGVLWVDTGTSRRETRVYSGSTGQWEPVGQTSNFPFTVGTGSSLTIPEPESVRVLASITVDGTLDVDGRIEVINT